MKRKIRRTGEIIDVITFSGSTIRSDYDKIQFYDSNGSVINESLNYYLDTLPVDDKNKDVDWEQRRYEMAKTMLPITSVSGRGPHGELILEACDKAAELAVIYADALIKELK